ncbi:GGDEF domain-containing protein [Pseudothauera nasutitermitis]|uniref:diguanylate cyclase n=1 Tax=Pseudothauera nasutitermitis TaxID=2565930 RepID=A0A4V3WCC2_9RHOO|nr:GGDEF domain-containing protein [Pseudothauera nasutitermitis]THF66578.1 GGDEF domain-containing protein [Pseudothauera nasutitermitis]
MKKLWNTICEHIVAPTQLSREQLFGLLTPFGRSVHMRRHAASVIIARVQLISALFAVLVPLWAVVDLLVFEGYTAFWLVLLRLGAAGVFAALAWPREVSASRPYAQAMLMLLIMLLVPPMFYLASLQIIDQALLSDGQRLVAQLYTFMPTIVLGGLAIFPLTALEILLFSVPVIGVAMVGMVSGGADLALDQHGAALWFMLMMMGVSMFSGMSQSHYMESLVYRAMTDPLTGAYTRRSGTEALELMYRLSSMSGKPLAVAFFDLDNFKSINDRHGHDAGDQALCTLVERLRQTLRRGDVLVRWGGEEFLAILPEMPAEQMPTFLGRLRRAGFGDRPDGRPLTASIGVAESLADGALDWQTLVELADQRMYQAKRGGRDRAVLPGAVEVPLAQPA